MWRRIRCVGIRGMHWEEEEISTSDFTVIPLISTWLQPGDQGHSAKETGSTVSNPLEWTATRAWIGRDTGRISLSTLKVFLSLAPGFSRVISAETVKTVLHFSP